jgi:DNA invertase Pin-like site-specific DNA recombinase
MKKVLIYCYTGAPIQESETNSASSQETLCEKFINESGKYELAFNGVYTDHSFLKQDRPMFKRLLRRVRKAKNIAGVVITSPERLTRNAPNFMVTQAMLKRFGAEIIIVGQTPQQRFIETVMSAHAKFYKETQGEKIKRGLARKKANQIKAK